MHKQLRLPILTGALLAAAFGAAAQSLTVLVRDYADVGIPLLERSGS